MGLRDRLRKAAPAPEPELTWEIQYDRGGRTYTYQRTRTAMAALLGDRAAGGRQGPYRVVAVVDGKPVEVQVDIG